jgi:hypothetical protein
MQEIIFGAASERGQKVLKALDTPDMLDVLKSPNAPDINPVPATDT